jgi:eukaryotic-like serine/threonine-protein kinase
MTLPSRFGRYELLARLAQGGMAEVFLARTGGASGFQKELVIKRILPEFTGDSQFVRMFVDEARLAAQLHHPNIVQVFDFDAIEGTYFIAMEYVEGCDLRTIMEETAARGESFELAEALYLTAEVAKALDYAHRRKQHGKPLNIVHRDVSPHNVLVSFEAAVKLADFGIAKAQSRATRTQDGIVKGKVSYMSPEQAKGRPLDGRSDLFSLGTVLFELLTLRRLFFADSDREILRKVMAADVPSPRSFKRDLPAEVERLTMRLLARHPEQRYGSAAELLEDLSRAYHNVAHGSSELLLRQRLARLFPERAIQATPSEPAPAPDDPGSWPPSVDWPGRTGTPVIPTPATPPPAREPHHRPKPPPLPGPARVSPRPTPLPLPSLREDPTEPVVVTPAAPPASQETSFGSPAGGSDPRAVAPDAKTRLHDPGDRPRSRHGRQVRRFDRQRVVQGEPGAKDEAFFQSGTRLYREERSRPRHPLRQRRPTPSLTTVSIVALLLVGVGALAGILYALGRADEPDEIAPPPVSAADAGPGEADPTRELATPPAPEGTVIVRTVPSGARVSVDGQELPGRTPLAVSMPLGRATFLTVELEGFSPETLEVVVEQAERPTERLLRLRELDEAAP